MFKYQFFLKAIVTKQGQTVKKALVDRERDVDRKKNRKADKQTQSETYRHDRLKLFLVGLYRITGRIPDIRQKIGRISGHRKTT